MSSNSIKNLLAMHKNLEIELFIAHVLKKPKEFLYLHPEISLSSHQVKSLSSLISRRKKGEPVAYILGYKDFMGLRFKVNKDVLIPRPETEGIIELALNRIKNYELGIRGSKPITILDLGTGSGCIAISLAKILPSINHNSRFIIHASDISKKALAIARQNARIHKVKINFIHSNILENMRIDFDVIVANLPYVPKQYYASNIKNLKWEPKKALIDPVRDFDLYRRFFKQAGKHINPGGVILLEIDPTAKKILKQYQEAYLPKAKIKFYKDRGGFWRFAEVTSGQFF